MRTKLLIDTDPGVDDAFALMLAVQSEVFDIVAITTVCGNSTIENSTRNARCVLESIGAKNIPVYQGASRPLRRPLRQAVVHGKDGLFGLGSAATAMSDGPAVEAILESIQASPGEVVIVALGPLTNIAEAIRRKPAVMTQVKEIVIMGGAVMVPGNMENGAEFNFFVDPEAARIVCESPVSVTIIPLDVCNSAVIDQDDMDCLQAESVNVLLRRLIQPYAASIYKDTGINGAVMYDPLAVYYAINPSVFVTQSIDLSIDTSNSGRGRVIRGENYGSMVTVATDFVPGFKFADEFMRITLG